MNSYVFKSAVIFLMLGLSAWIANAKERIVFTGTDIYGLNMRVLTMGNAFTAVAKTGETALSYNPAGLASTYPQRSSFSFGIDTDAAYLESARALVTDFREIQGSSGKELTPEQVEEFGAKYENQAQNLDAQATIHVAYQTQTPWEHINRIGMGIQGEGFGQVQLSFLQSSEEGIDIDQPAEDVADEVEEILEEDYGETLKPEEKNDLIDSIEDLKEGGKSPEEQQKILNRLIQQTLNSLIVAGKVINTGVAVSTLDQSLKIGLSFKNYNLNQRHLSEYPLAKVLTSGIDIDSLPQKSADAIGFDIGTLYSLEQFFLPDWRPQIGLVLQNVGGVDFGDDMNMKIVQTLNIGMSVTKEFGPALLILATDFTDITGNYYRLNEEGKKKKRSLLQRSHFGAEVGLGDAASMEHRYFYLRSGFNQGQFTWGIEASLPSNILRLGYGSYSVDIGDETKSNISKREIFYLSFGVVI